MMALRSSLRDAGLVGTTITGARRELGEQLAALRGAAGHKQTELAGLTGYSRSSIANAEVGRQPMPREFWVRADDLLGGQGALVESHDKITLALGRLRGQGARETAGERETRIEAYRRSVQVVRALTDATIGVVHRAFLGVHPLPDYEDVRGDLENRVLDACRQLEDKHATRPSLTLVGGFAGSGKSEFGRFLSTMTGWALLDKDTLTRPFAEALLLSLGSDVNDRHTALYREKIRPLEYRALINTALQNLDCGVSTVVTAPFISEIVDEPWLTRLKNQCAARAADVCVVWVECDEESMYDYLAFRGAARDAWKLECWEEYLSTIDLSLHPRCAHFVVDNRLNATISMAEQAVSLAARFHRG